MLTMISLGVGGILFMLGATFIEGTSLDEYARSGEFSYGEYQIGFSSNAVETMAHGRTGIQMKNPLSLEFIKQIEQIEGVKKVHRFERAEVKWEANGENVDDSVNTFSEKILKDMNRAMGTSLDYAEMAQKKELIINKNDLVQELFGWEFAVGDKIEITFFNGTENVTEEFTVAGILPSDYEEPSPKWQWLILPEQSVKEIMGNINLTDLLSVSTEKRKKKRWGSYPGTCGGESATCNGDNRGGKRQSGRTIPHAAWNDAWVVCVYYFIQSFKSFEYTDHQYGHKKTGICDAAVHRNVGKTIISDGTE